ncbi:putative serine/threonine protein phosphatase [Acinetobacter phage vB_AbaM_PhT2]|uniref:Putative serine/threonine protein phosphatase n=2 Tax=Hadassahvirus TaxID=2842716 RepID=A0A6B9SW95_9CAUD|nr:phosphoesterase [Acinetobacter phage AbTZA1]YP_009887244.1 phosphoesterase [Acinetobacter phage vB_AbaM_PhT2]AZU98609.1 putative serine/threonine protein phosphatase [Acinetobacter phage AbTZA1]QHJ75836.1 putative serine/threonine protein phosphatase [Acinetobacter phage vB_AbaM_PhT2]UQS94181.1 metallophosphatase [Acinetobacter phage AB-Navy71]
MSNVLFLGDAHLGHGNVARFRTQFRDEQDHFEHVEKVYYSAVTRRDVCYFTGDAVFTLERAKQVAKWPGKKILVCGNHDTDNLSMKQLCEVFDDVKALVKYKEFWLSHAPMHPSELRGKFNIHGHVHFATVDDCRYVNTSLEATDFKPIALYQVRDIIKARIKFYENVYSSYKTHLVPLPKFDVHAFAHEIPVGLK